MPRTAKITISLPEDVLQGIDRERQLSKESRSQFFRRAVESFLRGRREHKLEEQYIRGYLENPESPEEMEEVYRAGLAVLVQEPWEDGDGR